MPEKIDYTPHDSVIVNAVLCREVLEEKNGIISAIKIFDSVEYELGTAELAQFYVVCVMKCLNPQEPNHALGVHLISPHGKRDILDSGSTIKFDSSIEGMPLGAFHILTANLKIPGPGAHWLEIWVDGKFGAKLMIFFRPQGKTEQA